MNTILSYPRSGSNFLNNCLDVISPKPFGKTHAHYHRFWKENTLDKKDMTVMLVLRNYKECIPRHTKATTPEALLQHAVGLKATERPGAKKDANGRRFTQSDYMALVKWYHEYQGKKTIVYYEDFVTNTAEELRRLADFIGDVEEGTLENFIDNLDQHRKTSASKYNKFGKTTTLDKEAKPISTIQHSQIIPKAGRLRIDEHLSQTFPTLYEKYLKRYKES